MFGKNFFFFFSKTRGGQWRTTKQLFFFFFFFLPNQPIHSNLFISYLFNLLFPSINSLPCPRQQLFYLPTQNITYQDLLVHIFDTKIKKIPHFLCLIQTSRENILVLRSCAIHAFTYFAFFLLHQKMSLQGPFQEFLCLL